jgi:Mrp family chromosome partitioning ATPase
MADQRVLVVDANLKSPQLHQMLGIANSRGLSEVLSGLTPVEEVIESVPFTNNLFVLTAGQTSAESGKWLASNQMKHLVQKLHDEFDLVIYDTPSYQDSSDASFLTSYASNSLIVIGNQKTSRSVANQMIQEFENFNLPCMGVVVNYVNG